MTLRIFLLRFSAAFLWVPGAASVPLAAEVSRARPNIIVILADDLGYGDVRSFNPERGKIPTPHLDRLAAQGMRFMDAHSSSGVCSPSRYTLLTGRYHWRTRLQSGIVGVFGPPLIAPDRLTLGSLAQQHGYRTAAIGKWHLGWDWPMTAAQRVWLQGPPKGKFNDDEATALPEPAAIAAWREIFSQPILGGPTTRGFHQYFGTDVPNWPPFCFIENDRTIGIPSEFLPVANFKTNLASLPGPALADWKLENILPTLRDRAAEFIRDAARRPEPFLLYLPLTSPHTPLSVNAEWRGKSGLSVYADFVMETDAAVGRVLGALEESGAAANTLVVFTSDNGCAPYIGVVDLEAQGHFPSGPLRGYKADAWEGGHRVPFIVRWPGIVSPGRTSTQLVAQADLLATIADILGFKLPANAGEDSFSLLPLFQGKDQPVRDQAISCAITGVPSLRQGPWKLLLAPGSGGWSKGGGGNPVQLYDLQADIGETRNLATAEPERVAKMQTLLEKLISEGRSTPGAAQKNDTEVKRYPAKAAGATKAGTALPAKARS